MSPARDQRPAPDAVASAAADLRDKADEFLRLQADEAAGCEARAAVMGELSRRHATDPLAEVLRALARDQRIRAMELRARAAALAVQYGLAQRTDA